MYEKSGKSRTFLITLDDKNLTLLGYFTLSLKELTIFKGSISNKKFEKIPGTEKKEKKKSFKQTATIFIGQLGRSDLSYDKNIINNFSGKVIMDYCINKILDGQRILGGKIIMLECKKDASYVHDFYKKYDFYLLDKDYRKENFFQMIRILNKKEIIEL